MEPDSESKVTNALKPQKVFAVLAAGALALLVWACWPEPTVGDLMEHMREVMKSRSNLISESTEEMSFEKALSSYRFEEASDVIWNLTIRTGVTTDRITVALRRCENSSIAREHEKKYSNSRRNGLFLMIFKSGESTGGAELLEKAFASF